MILAKNNVEVEAVNWDRPYLFEPGFVALKVDVRVKTNRPEEDEPTSGPVYLQVTEHVRQTFDGPDAVDKTMLLELGFHSIPFAQPLTAIRFKAYGPLPGLFDLKVFG